MPQTMGGKLSYVCYDVHKPIVKFAYSLHNRHPVLTGRIHPILSPLYSLSALSSLQIYSGTIRYDTIDDAAVPPLRPH